MSSQLRRTFRDSFTRPKLELLEERLTPTSNPFNSPTFQQAMTNLLENFDVPQTSLAVSRDGQTYTFEQTNAEFFTKRNLPQPAPVTPQSLFRVGSVTKSFTSVALMTLVQAGDINLSDSAFAVLGFKPGETISGFDPLDGKTDVSAVLPDSLFAISIASLMGMTSGLPLDVPVKSSTFPNAPDDQVIYEEGSYAALTFAGKPPYTMGPATSQQQLNYYLFEVSTEIANGTLSLPIPGSTYTYNDTGYTILGNIVEAVAQSKFGMDYADYLQQFVLTPLGISAPGSSPTSQSVAGIGHTLAADAYPNEVTYYSYANELPKPNIFPDNTKLTAPFYPTDGQNAVTVPQPYGGNFYLESHFGNGGMVATPTALVNLFTQMEAVENGTVSTPINQQTLLRMIAEPPIGEDLLTPDNVPYGWYGLGWQISAPLNPPAPDNLVWFKNGDLPGNSAELSAYRDGTVWAAEFNIDVLSDGTKNTDPSPETPFAQQLRMIIDQALYATATFTVVSGSGQTTTLGGSFPQPLQLLVQDSFGDPRGNMTVTLTPPASGPGVTFSGPTTFQTNAQGLINVPVSNFQANGTAGTYAISAVTGGLSAVITLTNIVDSSVSPVLPTGAGLYGPGPNSSVQVAYIHGLYQNVFGRQADALGLGWWVGQLNSGMSPALVAQAFWNSSEHRGIEVASYYAVYLNRPASAAEQQFWVGQFQQGATETSVVLAILSSQEYQSVHSTDSDFISGLYDGILDRAPDSPGQQAALAFLAAGGSRQTLALIVLQSLESYVRALNGYYGAYLQRPADTVGEILWANALVAGAFDYGQVAIAFLSSNEYLANAAAAVG